MPVEWAGGNLLAIAGVFLGVDTLFLIARFLSRFWVKRAAVGLDDYFIVGGYVGCMGICGLAIGVSAILIAASSQAEQLISIFTAAIVQYAGVGYHIEDALARDPHVTSKLLKSIFAQDYIYLAGISFPKLAILALYQRIFPQRWLQISSKVLMGFVVAYWISFIVATSVQCVPIVGYWDKTVPATCFNDEIYFQFVSPLSVVIDLPIILLPLPIIYRLQTSPARKALFFAVFGCGSLGIIACIARLVLFFERSAFVDPTFASVYLIGMSVIESSLYFIAACMMAMKPIVQYAFEKTVPEKTKLWLLLMVKRTNLSPRAKDPTKSPSAQLTDVSQKECITSWYGTRGARDAMTTTVKGGSLSSDAALTAGELGVQREVWVQHSPADPFQRQKVMRGFRWPSPSHKKQNAVTEGPLASTVCGGSGRVSSTESV